MHVTSETTFVYGEDEVIVCISDTQEGYSFRLIVNGEEGPWSSNRFLLYFFSGWFLPTDYWDSLFRPYKPFKITYANLHHKHQQETEEK